VKLKKLGKDTLKFELNISKFGLWLFINNVEYFLSYKDYPWFQDAKISDIYNIKFLHNYHLHWPNLDIDLDLDSLENLDKYPLISRKK
jgi:hypothetical protein